MLAIACRYDDADDLDHLRTDPGFKLACGRLPDSGAELCSGRGPDERIELRARRRMTAPITRRHREGQHLRHRPRVNPKTPRRLTTADPLDPHGVADPTIQFDEPHPPALCAQRKEHPTGGLLRRRSQTTRSLPLGIFTPARTLILAGVLVPKLPHLAERVAKVAVSGYWLTEAMESVFIAAADRSGSSVRVPAL